MAEYQVPSFKFVDSEEAREALAKSIAEHKDRITLDSEGVRIITPIEEAVRIIVREELAALKADIVKQVMSDISTEIRLQQGLSSHESRT